MKEVSEFTNGQKVRILDTNHKGIIIKVFKMTREYYRISLDVGGTVDLYGHQITDKLERTNINPSNR